MDNSHDVARCKACSVDPRDAEIARLQAQVDALADALQACIRSNERWSLTPGRTNAISTARAALAAVGR